MEELPAELTNFQQKAENEKTLASRSFQLPKDSLEKARLAQNPCTTPKTLKKLSKISDDTTRTYLATNPNSPIEVLRKLAREYPRQVLSNPVLPLLFIENPHIVDDLSLPLNILERFAIDPQTPREILALLVQSQHRQVQESARLHVNWAGEMTTGWDEAGNRAIKAAVLSEKIQLKELLKINLLPNSSIANLVSDILPELAFDRRWYVRAIVAENRNAPVSLLEKLAKDEEPWVRGLVAENRCLSANLLEELAGDRDASIRRAVAYHHNTPVELLEKLAKDEDATVRCAVAEHQNAPLDLLEKLAKDPFNKVRVAVAWNCKTPASLLDKLGKEVDGETYQNVAVYPNTPVSSLEVLAKTGNFSVRRKIAKHPHAPATLLRQLAEGIDELSRKNVAENPHTPIDVLESLLDDRETCVRTAAVERYLARNPQGIPIVLVRYGKKFTSSLTLLLILLHPQTPSKTLSDSCRSHSWLERYAVAQHSHTPSHILKNLITDGNRIVRAAAKANLQRFPL